KRLHLAVNSKDEDISADRIDVGFAVTVRLEFPPKLVHQLELCPELATKLSLVGSLNPCLADHVALAISELSPRVTPVVCDLAHVAERVPCVGVSQVPASLRNLKVDARQPISILLDATDDVEGQVCKRDARPERVPLTRLIELTHNQRVLYAKKVGQQVHPAS